MSDQKRAILQDKVDSVLEMNAKANVDVYRQMEHDMAHMNDYILDMRTLGKSHFVAGENNVHLMEYGTDDVHDWTFHPHALKQMAEKLGAPPRYITDLAQTDWGRTLISKIFNDHQEHGKRDRLLVREIKGEIRGVLSDKYRRLNSQEIYASFLNQSRENGALLYKAHYNEVRTSMETIIPEVLEVETELNGSVYSVFGAKMRNSDFGSGRLALHLFQMNVICLNGMTSSTVVDQVHLGKRLPDNVAFSNETYRLDTQAMASAVTDIMKQLYGRETILEQAQMIQRAGSTPIEVSPYLERLPKMGMLKGEVDLVQSKLIDSNPEEGIVGQSSLWKLSQAITAVSNEQTADRREDINAIAGKLLKYKPV